MFRKLFFLSLYILAAPVAADSMCYTQRAYPHADFLKRSDAGVSFLTQPLGMDNIHGRSYTLTRMTGNADGFAPEGEAECEWGRCEGEERIDACPKDMPEIHIAEEDIPDWLKNRWHYEFKPEFLEQAPGACTTVGDEVYFGLAFYGGEGAVGLGGVGRWNRKTGELEVRHPERLQRVSINHLAFDGERLWLGTYYNSECSGEIPEKRVLVYDWEKDRFEDGQGIRNPLTCGYVANGFVQTEEGVMWVASDLGLSRITFRTHPNTDYYGDRIFFGQTHWWAVETPDGARMQQGSCDDLYSQMLMVLPAERIPTYTSVLSQFVSSLHQFNGYFLQHDYKQKIYADRGLDRMSYVLRNLDDEVLVQNCESGELFMPKGHSWGSFEHTDKSRYTAPGSAVESVRAAWVEPRPAADGENHRSLRLIDSTQAPAPHGYCAGVSQGQ